MGSHGVSGRTPPSKLCSLKHASLQSFIAICHTTATVLMSMVPHHSSQTIPGDMRSPTHTPQPRGWPPFNRDALTCFMAMMPMPKRQPGPSQPQQQPCCSKLTERLEEHPRGQSGRAHQSTPAGLSSRCLWQRLHLLFISSKGSKQEVPDSKPELTLYLTPETAACSGGQAAAKSSPNLSTRHRTVATTNS